jgi:hypothetical protein
VGEGLVDRFPLIFKSIKSCVKPNKPHQFQDEMNSKSEEFAGQTCGMWILTAGEGVNQGGEVREIWELMGVNEGGAQLGQGIENKWRGPGKSHFIPCNEFNATKVNNSKFSGTILCS